jgi:RNA polymerase sigma-70 factor (ECF subfamily)
MTSNTPVPMETLLTHRDWVRRLARSLVRDEASVDDVEQRTWLAALRRPPLDASTSRAWLSRVVRNEVFLSRRADGRRAAHEQVGARRRDVRSTATVVAEAESHKLLVMAVLDLPEPQRATVLLRWFEDLPPREVARRMDVPVETVRTRLRRAHESLRERLGAGAPSNVALALAPLVGHGFGKAAGTTGGIVMGTKAVVAAGVVGALVGSAALGVVAARRGDELASAQAQIRELSGRVDAAATKTVAPRRASSDEQAADASTKAFEARIADLESRLAAANEKAADADALDPIAWVLYSRKPIAWKARKLLAMEPEKDRQAATWKLGQALGEKPGSAREMLDALAGETDAKIVALYAEMLRAGAALHQSPDDWRAFVELLRHGSTPELRAAAVRGVAPYAALDEKTKPLLEKEMPAVLLDVLRTDKAPEVVGAVANYMAGQGASTDALDALKSAAARLSACPARRSVWEAIACWSFMPDQGASLSQQFQAATSQDVKDDIAAGIARAGNSMTGFAGGKPEEIKKRAEDARARFKIVFGGTSDVAVRKTLARAALYGMGCIAMVQTDEGKSDAARFFRDLAGLEPDATQRDRLEKVAAAFEQKGAAAYEYYDKIMSEKQ